ncbi:Fructosamine kinase-domain-containing protein [Annulohypoxylon truncatum]|uniref:Fructosamine kinase-domain-containing protein n=1 Tax=Annulohypoxylon truncatum TaxID=327061 RepID=UPI0020074006|nr:Fructosamine kinase-domain-containing protein [Annulohypoxylon truncatum]KAI1204372.1 Fructosamine kinase-domain-containing protein [Annulohypoxylon truncatum]
MEGTQEVKVPIEAIQVVDPEVIAKLPHGIRVLTIAAHGASFWTRTARLDVEEDGTRKAYFLKTTYGELGREMMSSEFACMSKVRGVAPDLVPEPVAWGSYVGIPHVHFLVCEFRPMTGEVPAAADLARKIAELHRKSSVGGAEAKFGSDVPTFHGNVRVEHGWSHTWEEYFARTTRALFELELETRGDDIDVVSNMIPLFEKVIPRLLRPLQTGNHSIRPCLIHGDLWHGNTGSDAETGLPIIFDAASFYAHNEYELGVWRQPWNKINKAYREEYHKHFPKSWPEEDFDDRNALYAIRVNLLDSILYKDDPSYRQMLISGMRDLVDKFPGGFQEWEASQARSDDQST